MNRIQTLQYPFEMSARYTPVVSILSASGSANLPKFVMRFFFRAIFPSKKSVMPAMKYRMVATR